MRGPLTVGEKVLLIDPKGRRYLVTLKVGGEFHSHGGYIPHDELIGRSEGTTVKATKGLAYTALRPTLGDFVLKMPRGAQVIYPKDIAPILMLADVYPGARVLESGVGSGALSLGLLRAGADVVGYELREDFAAKAAQNVVAFSGEGVLERYRVEIRDCYEGIDETALDRIVLDLPEPWQVVKHAERALSPGGILRRVHADDRAGRAAPRVVGRSTVPADLDDRGAAPQLAHRRAVGATRSPDGRAHRLPDLRTSPRLVTVPGR